MSEPLTITLLRRDYRIVPRLVQAGDGGTWKFLDVPNTPFWYASFYSWRDAMRAWLLWERKLASARVLRVRRF